MAKQNKTKWDALSMKDRASFIRIGIKNGITNLEKIREEYNKYADGGPVKSALPSSYFIPDQQSPFWSTIQNELVKSPTEGSVDINELKRRQAWTETRGDDNAVSPKGAKGRYQIMPNVLKEYEEKTGDKGDLFNPVYNERVRDWQIKRIQQSRTVNNNNPTDSVLWGKTMAAYNWGIGNLGNALMKAKNDNIDIYNTFDWIDSKYLPKETIDYVNFILRNKDSGAHRTNEQYNNRKTSYATGGELDGLEESPTTQRSSQEYINGVKSFLMEVAEKMAFGYPYTPSIFEHIEQAKNNKYEDLSRSAFLFSKEEQEKAFSDAGYIIDTSGNYGLVKKAVGNRKLPIYKKNKDVVDRSQLTPIFNLDSRWLGSRESSLEDPGEFPSVVYKDKNGNFYQNAWDLQDYGESSAGSGGHKYPKIKQLAANLLDVIGNPFVVTTGIQPVDPYEMFMYAHGKPGLLKDFYKTLNKDEVYKYQTRSAKYLYYDYKNRQRHMGNESVVSFKDFIEHIDKYTTKEEQINGGYLKDF